MLACERQTFLLCLARMLCYLKYRLMLNTIILSTGPMAQAHLFIIDVQVLISSRQQIYGNMFVKNGMQRHLKKLNKIPNVFENHIRWCVANIVLLFKFNKRFLYERLLVLHMLICMLALNKMHSQWVALLSVRNLVLEYLHAVAIRLV